MLSSLDIGCLTGPWDMHKLDLVTAFGTHQLGEDILFLNFFI